LKKSFTSVNKDHCPKLVCHSIRSGFGFTLQDRLNSNVFR